MTKDTSKLESNPLVRLPSEGGSAPISELLDTAALLEMDEGERLQTIREAAREIEEWERNRTPEQAAWKRAKRLRKYYGDGLMPGVRALVARSSER